MPRAIQAELLRLDRLLARALREARSRGRSQLAEMIGGYAIEEGEAEGLLGSLVAAHSGQDAPDPDAAGDHECALEPLARAARLYDLSAVERDVLLLASAVEIDSRYGRLIAFLNDHVQKTRPTVGLALAVLGVAETDRARLIDRIGATGPLRRFGLVMAEEGPPAPPAADRALVVAGELWPRLFGVDRPPLFAVRRPAEVDMAALALPEQARAEADRAVAWARAHAPESVLIAVSGPAGCGRETLACSIAGALGMSALVVAGADLGRGDLGAAVSREAVWHGAAIVLCEPPEGVLEAVSRAIAGVKVPLLCTLGEGHGLDRLDGARRALSVALPRTDARWRAGMWRRLLAGHAADVAADAESLADSLAGRFRFGPGKIEAAVRIAAERSRAASAGGVSAGALDEVCRGLPRASFGGLASRLPCPFTAHDIVLAPATRRELDLVTAWARHAARIFGGAGPGARLRAGHALACLFHGPPGTGKTMAAQVLARQVGLDAYRIDLSQVVDKYIGETEKNLARVFDAAAEANAILFFDEADALFGKRSEVKDSHDRYANIETGFLLQRMEEHEGISILATNLRRNLDDAFLRRLHVVAEFPMPGVAERQAIWGRLLPRGGAGVDAAFLAKAFAIAGGDIRNAVMAGLLLAASEGAALAMRHVILGVWREVQKSGRVLDPDSFGPWRADVLAFAGLC